MRNSTSMVKQHSSQHMMTMSVNKSLQHAASRDADNGDSEISRS